MDSMPMTVLTPTELAEELIRSLPAGSATFERQEIGVRQPNPVALKLFGHPGQFRGQIIQYCINPTNPRAAAICFTDDFDLFVGQRFIMENYFRRDRQAVVNDVRRACREAFAGRFEETLWRDKHGRTVSSVSRFPNLDWRPMRHVWRFGRLFKRTTEEHLAYEPYAAGV